MQRGLPFVLNIGVAVFKVLGGTTWAGNAKIANTEWAPAFADERPVNFMFDRNLNCGIQEWQMPWFLVSQPESQSIFFLIHWKAQHVQLHTNADSVCEHCTSYSAIIVGLFGTLASTVACLSRAIVSVKWRSSAETHTFVLGYSSRYVKVHGHEFLSMLCLTLLDMCVSSLAAGCHAEHV